MHHKMCWNNSDNQAANDSSNGSHVTWLASVTSDPFACRFAAVRIKRAMLQDQVSVPEFGQNVRRSHVVSHMHYVGAAWGLLCQPQVPSRYIYPLLPIYVICIPVFDGVNCVIVAYVPELAVQVRGSRVEV